MILTPGIFARTTTFILGSEKHAGKTTLLNYLVRLLRGREPLAYLSVGLDGEGADALSGASKPRVVAAEGDWLVTARQALDRGDVAAEIREVFPSATILGPSVLVRVVRAGSVELVGPGTNEQLARVLEHVVSEAGIETVLVDGAVNRVTQVAASSRGACLYVLRIDRSNVARAIDTMRRLFRLQNAALATDDVLADEATRVVDGALTSERAHDLDAACRAIVVQDFSRVFLSHAELVALERRVQLRVRTRIELRAFVVNLHDLARRDFADMLGDPAMAEQVVFNPYQEEVA